MPKKRKYNVLSIQNARNWSWGLVMPEMMKPLGDYTFTRILRHPRTRINFNCCACETANAYEVSGQKIEIDLIDHFDVTLTQNVDALFSIEGSKHKVIARIGGIAVCPDANGKEITRYDEELKQCGHVVATNQALYDLAARVNKNVTLIPNGIDLELFSPAPNTPNLERRFTVGFAGNILGRGLHYKGYKFWVKAIIGMHAEINTHKAMFHVNQCPHEEMPETFYSKIDCLILPSLGEGCSNVTMEALACGVPMLTTKVGYHGELLTDMENCIFIERDPRDIEAKIRLLKDSPELRKRLSKNGRLFAEKHHDIGVIAAEYDKIFRSIIGKEQSNGKG